MVDQIRFCNPRGWDSYSHVIDGYLCIYKYIYKYPISFLSINLLVPRFHDTLHPSFSVLTVPLKGAFGKPSFHSQDGLRALGHDVQLVAGWQRLVFGRGQVIRRGLRKNGGNGPYLQEAWNPKGHLDMAYIIPFNYQATIGWKVLQVEDILVFFECWNLSQLHFFTKKWLPTWGEELLLQDSKDVWLEAEPKCFPWDLLVALVHLHLFAFGSLLSGWRFHTHYDSEHLQDDVLWNFYLQKLESLLWHPPAFQEWHPQLFFQPRKWRRVWRVPCAAWRWSLDSLWSLAMGQPF